MNLALAKKAEVGAMVRHAWDPKSSRKGIVLSKEHITGPHTAKVLGSLKHERFDFWVQWLGTQKPPEKLQNWEVMLVEEKSS